MGPRPPFGGNSGPMRPAISYRGGNRFPPSGGRGEPLMRSREPLMRARDWPPRQGPQSRGGYHHGAGDKRPQPRSAGGYQVKKYREDPYREDPYSEDPYNEDPYAEAGYVDQLESSYDPYNEVRSIYTTLSTTIDNVSL